MDQAQMSEDDIVRKLLAALEELRRVHYEPPVCRNAPGDLARTVGDTIA
jgi:hypothetical protein